MVSQKLKILFITGSYPPKICGVGDYTFKLLSFLKQNEGFKFDLFYKNDWSLKFFRKYLTELRAEKPDFYHMQYPTEGYGYSFVPLLLILFLPARKTIVTVHELSNRNFMAYIYTLLLIMLSGSVIVSNELERTHACRYLLNKRKVRIIPIASNIKTSDFSADRFEDRTIDLAYFGHIRPIKGIEDFMETVSYLPDIPNAAIIGQSLKRYEQYFEDIVDQSTKLNISIIANKDEDEIADILANVKIVYLPFPDGVSNRRGSLLAAIQNGCVIVTRPSDFEPFNLYFDRYCYLVKSNQEATDTIQKLLKREYNARDMTAIKADLSWNTAVKEHFSIYNVNNE